ncbi:hypothetical protein Bbelb_137870 [Branchiostoma belcheri]|nr:hypothetical protein Bbelb_137870 [Branchiostoma belcheri]
MKLFLRTSKALHTYLTERFEKAAVCIRKAGEPGPTDNRFNPFHTDSVSTVLSTDNDSAEWGGNLSHRVLLSHWYVAAGEKCTHISSHLTHGPGREKKSGSVFNVVALSAGEVSEVAGFQPLVHKPTVEDLQRRNPHAWFNDISLKKKRTRLEEIFTHEPDLQERSPTDDGNVMSPPRRKVLEEILVNHVGAWCKKNTHAHSQASSSEERSGDASDCYEVVTRAEPCLVGGGTGGGAWGVPWPTQRNNLLQCEWSLEGASNITRGGTFGARPAAAPIVGGKRLQITPRGARVQPRDSETRVSGSSRAADRHQGAFHADVSGSPFQSYLNSESNYTSLSARQR